MRKMMVALLLALAACGGTTSVCQPTTTGQEAACTLGVTENTSAQSCTDSTGSAFICRNGLGFCVVCQGPAFTEGCALSTTGSMSYCVKDCSHC